MAKAAADFAQRWEGKGYERGESQLFWADLLENVYGVEDLPSFIRYEEQVKNMVDATNFIDAYIPSTKVLIEQKSLGKDLRKSIQQSDGSLLNPFQQAKRYAAELPYSQRPRWIVTSNFAEFLVYDMECPHGEPEQIWLKELGKEYYRLQFLVDNKNEHLTKEMQVSMKAGEIVGKIYDALTGPLLSTQGGKISSEMLHDINVLCVRLVFCLYAEDAGVFGRRDMFHDYLAQYNTKDMRQALIRLFETLATPIDKRDPFLEPDLAQFPYVNGGLFGDPAHTATRRNTIPPFTDSLRRIVLQNASLDFDWSEISPTIFGAVFESTLNPVTRRSGGMHYTSIENIHKVIDPLFLNGLRQELDAILEEKAERIRQRKLDQYQDKLASLTFLDPACGSGNFLTETYLSLRRLENEVIRERYHGQSFIGFEEVNPVKVSIQQFYGIEINDFAVTVATIALWISEAQMLAETERIIHRDIDFLPLKTYANIREGNALRMDWGMMEYPADIPAIHAKNTYIVYEDKEKGMVGEPNVYDEVNLYTTDIQRGPKPNRRETIQYDYIMGNPPFVGYSLQSKEQKEDTLSVFVDGQGKPFKAAGKIDYVAGWYYKAAQMVKSTNTLAALVSTNSITQGEQVAAIWKPLRQLFGIRIDFAHRTFQWDSESSQKAHVHCVVIGFSSVSCGNATKNGTTNVTEGKKGEYSRHIYDNGHVIEAANINAYLMDAPDVFIESRKKSLCDVPPMVYGNKPVDGGFLFLTADERRAAIGKEPQIGQYIKRIYGSVEYINNRERYCLWLVNANPSDLHNSAFIHDRIAKVRQFRLTSPKMATQISAETPTLFQEIRQPTSEYIIVPRVSSENRKYVPMGFVSPNIIVNDSVQIIPNASLYHFGVLTSNVHMAWMRAVCGRLKSDYRYSKDIVYNNFPWPNPTEEQKDKIEQTAQAILDARALYPEASLADLYDDLTMPVELRKAHQQNDRAVMAAYGSDVKMSESQCVAELFKLYQDLTKE